MNTRLFRGALIGLLLPVVGCAVSTVLDDDISALGSDQTTDEDDDEGLDGISDDESLSVRRDAGNGSDDEPASVDAGGAKGKDAAVVADASALDAGRDAGQLVVDGGKAQGVDAGKPPVVDAGTTPPVVTPLPLPAGCSEKTLQSHRYAFCSSELSFTDARQACLTAGMDLVIVGDRTESDFVATNGESWIGATYVSDMSAYLAVVPGNPSRLDGAAIGYVNWAQGNPSATTRCARSLIDCHVALSSETCIEITRSGRWDDASCTRRKGFVCESY